MNDQPELSGPTFAPAAGGSPQQLVILCHGVGSDGQDLIGLAPYFAKVLPNAQFVSPNAPYPFDMAPMGYQWFSLENPTPQSRLEGVQQAAPILDAFIDQQMALYDVADKDVALVGFSQGSMMSLYVGVRRARALAGVVAYSGALLGPELLESEVKSQPPILMMHGSADDVVPPENLYEGVLALQTAGLTVKGEVLPNLGHGLNDRCIMAGMEFLAECFGVDLAGMAANSQPDQPLA